MSEPLREAPECGSEAAGRKFYCYALEPVICPPGVEAKNCAVKLAVSIGGTPIAGGLAGYIAAVYTFLLSIAGILAGIMITVGGFEWLLAAGSSEKITHAKKRIQNAIIGMVLALGTYVILQTINPALLNLSLPPVKLSRRMELAESGLCNSKNLPATERLIQGKYTCGKPGVSCADNPAVCGGKATGTCIGDVCMQNVEDECSKLDFDRSDIFGVAGTDKDYGCVKKSDCGGNCGSINPMQGNGMSACVSEVCVKKFGKPCLLVAAGQNFICANPKKAGESCTKNKECESEICNTGYVSDKCAPVGGSPSGEPCDEDRHCGKGLVCNAFNNLNPTCLPPAKGGDGCVKENDCISKNCDLIFGAQTLGGCCRCKKAGGGLKDCQLVTNCADD